MDGVLVKEVDSSSTAERVESKLAR